jgi:hypothetical protein
MICIVGDEVDEPRLRRILCLFKLETDNGFVAEMAGKPVYLGLAMDEAGGRKNEAAELACKSAS